ncbi:TM0106 family RecB-like putative nuclease [Rhodococcus sp. YH1]|uniref:TM0106 family RecB-like putative nuclease n=1 Tax=Rhodococcus sp. YH1 TaxID=89066 RepID=UPI001386ADB0|nr:hypothetical protein [Rhodococcus sp. YH1]
MFLLDGSVAFSASDLVRAAECEFAVMRTLDAVLGVAESPEPVVDPVLARAAELGQVHEHRHLSAFEARFGAGVVTVERPVMTAHALATAADATVAALTAGHPVIYQGALFDGRLVGFADFLVKENDGYAVYDTKLARRAKVPALLQLAAYADALHRRGIPVSRRTHLLLGDDTTASYPVAELVPVYLQRRARLQSLIDDHHHTGTPAVWEDGRYAACGRCAVCEPEVAAARDLLLVAGMRATQRARLRAAGVDTLDALATGTGPVPGMSDCSLAALRAQAAVQVRQEQTGQPVVEVFAPAALAALPAPDAGDVFFDFEGDPLWAEHGSAQWGLEYLFGVLEGSAQAPRFRPRWAHTRGEERRALLDFLDYLTVRRREYPQLHVYHYAAYEKIALLRLAGRHGVGEETVDELLRSGVLVDLYPIVRSALRVGQRGYGLKQLEPLYLGPRGGDVTTGAASIVAYADYCALREAGDTAAAQAVLAEIAAYNEADCLSTLRLRDWLLAQAAGAGVCPDGAAVIDDDAVPEPPAPSAHEARLLAFADADAPEQHSGEQQAAALMAAALGYHRRERKPFWWGHYDRLRHPVDEWADVRDTLIAAAVTCDRDWHTATAKQRRQRRHLTLIGDFAPGSTVRAGQTVYLLYEAPAPAGLRDGGACTRGYTGATIRNVSTRTVDGVFRDVVEVEELLGHGVEEYTAVPMALAPGPPVRTVSIEHALETVADRMCRTLPAMPHTAAVDVLRRIAPRTRSGAALPAVTGGDYVAAITAAVRDLDESYLAVQGPPGTGKTYTAARVIAELVTRHHWTVGVVAQSHSVVENLLDEIVDAGVPGERVLKPKAQKPDPVWTPIEAAQFPALMQTGVGGCVLGGTAWDFTNTRCVAPGCLDVLVVDEAGQFCLANTVAVATAARNLLLFGDPQQLPQVTQGTHPEPVDVSVLAWLADGHDTLPPQRGYFLAHTWRLHPALCERISQLSYDGKLGSQRPVTAARSLTGLAPGVHPVLVEHHGNATSCPEEAAEVVHRIEALLGSEWRNPAAFAGTRPLTEAEVLVVAPYNAQVNLIKTHLARAGLTRVQVGTVDKFQGRQAAVVVVSMTASAVEDIPRGMGFLLSRHRLNVAVSRALWATLVLRSPGLTDYLPATPQDLLDLGAFLRLTDPTTTPSST